MKARRKAFIHSADLSRYPYPESCPFNTTRAERTRETLASLGLLHGHDLDVIAPAPAPRACLETFHTPAYLDALERASRRQFDAHGLHMGLGSPDCPVFDGLFEYATLAAGATLTAARLLLAEKAWIAFNPSGGYHHAFADHAGGFCYLNDVVLACLELARAGCRVAFVDIDAHHCDGVQAAFYDRQDVLTLSLHESGHSLFPGTGFETETGAGAGVGFSVNLPLPPHTYDAVYLWAFQEAALPVLRAYAPDVLVVEVGADTLAGDPLAHLSLTNNAIAEVLELLLRFDRPLLVTGGGGYNVANTARAWALTWATLCGNAKDQDEMAGLGGVMLESTDWQGGLRDRHLILDVHQRRTVDEQVADSVARMKAAVFPLHGL